MNFEEFKTKYNINLTSQQLEAVKSAKGAVLLLAVPGSGKTTVLVNRLGYMYHCCNIAPENILTITYTTAATSDMSQRFAKIFGEELAGRYTFKTINAISLAILRYYCQVRHKTMYELVSEEKVLAKIITDIYRDLLKEYPADSDVKAIKTAITYIKNMMLNEEQIREMEDDLQVPIYDFYVRYCSALKKNNQMDFDDQMVFALQVLRQCPEVLEHFQNMYPYICVDEAQDTSKIQHIIIDLISKKSGNIFMVGDEDQSIYGFRAAYPEALLNFEKNYTNAKVLLMEENFRSNAEIVVAANKFISRNKMRHKKNMTAYRDAGSNINVISASNRKAQYSYLLKVAQNCDRQTAVLYRDNESVIPFIDLMDRNGISYQSRNVDTSFFTNKVIVDVCDIMRFAFDMGNKDLFSNIYYKIGTYLAKNEVERLIWTNTTDLLSAAIEDDSISSRKKSRLGTLRSMFISIRNENNPRKAINVIMEYIGYGRYLEDKGIHSGKVDILSILAIQESTIQSFLGRLTELKQLIEDNNKRKSEGIILTTIHSSKGLEYDTVYLIDCYDGIFPADAEGADNPEKAADYEEERRLFYVGVTRAKNYLNIFRIENEKSTFLGELVGSSINKRMPEPAQGKFANQLRLKKNTEIPVSTSEFNKFVEQLGEGMVVEHKAFGKGIIVSIDAGMMEVLFTDKDEIKKLHLLTLFNHNMITF